jgi:D-lactate dehydrogenase (cytochrome)
MISCNASGARSFCYGPTRNYVQRLRVVLADGAVAELTRGENKARGRQFILSTDASRTIEGRLPSYAMPAVKNAAGYFVEDNMDLIDLFIGAEGTLGIVAETDLRLIPVPGAMWGVQTFLPSEPAAVTFARKLRKMKLVTGSPVRVAALEFMGNRALELLRGQKSSNPAFQEVPDISSAWDSSIYVEFHGGNEDAVENAVMGMAEIMTECGGDEDATWVASDAREMERLKAFRHAIPEAVNLLIDERRKVEPALTKLGTDLAVPDESLEAMLSLYHGGLQEAGLDYVIFGHIGDNHVHVNILPNTLEEYARGRDLYLEWARAVVKMGGTVSAEHGIGKLKREQLAVMMDSRAMGEMRALKALVDPDGRLNPGNLF